MTQFYHFFLLFVINPSNQTHFLDKIFWGFDGRQIFKISFQDGNQIVGIFLPRSEAEGEMLCDFEFLKEKLSLVASCKKGKSANLFYWAVFLPFEDNVFCISFFPTLLNRNNSSLNAFVDNNHCQMRNILRQLEFIADLENLFPASSEVNVSVFDFFIADRLSRSSKIWLMFPFRVLVDIFSIA